MHSLLTGEDATGLIAQWRSLPAAKAGLPERTAATVTPAPADALRQLEMVLASGRVLDDRLVAQRALDLVPRIASARLLLGEHFDQVSARLADIGAAPIASARLREARDPAEHKLIDLQQRLDTLIPALTGVAKDGSPSFADGLLAGRRVEQLHAILQTLDEAQPSRVLGVNPIPQQRPLLAPRSPVETPAIVPSYAVADHDISPLPTDVAPSEDAPFADAILAKAASLDHDYIRIFDFVRSSIDTQWYAGVQKGAEETLRSGAGNDADQASLLVALLRASGAPARFVRGVIEVPLSELEPMLGVSGGSAVSRALTRAGIAAAPVVRGGSVAAMKFDHIWVSARVPYANYRGAVVDTSGSAWIPLAPAIKPYRYRPLDGQVRSAPINRQALWQRYLDQPPNALPLAEFERLLQDHLNTRPGQPSLDALTAKRVIDATPLRLLPASLPFVVKVVSAESATLPPEQLQRMTVTVYDVEANPILVASVPVRDLLNRRVTLSYVPATADDHDVILRYGGLGIVPSYLVRLRPQLNVGGKAWQTAAGDLPMTAAHRVELRLSGPAGEVAAEQTLIAGSYAALVVGAQGAAPVPQADGAQLLGDEEQLAAQLLANIGMRYVGAWDAAEDGFGALLGINPVRPFPSALLVVNEVTVEHTAGLATSLQWKGVSLDALLRPVEPLSDAADAAAERDWLALAGLHGSVLEHAVFEQQWSVDSVSADKGLALAQSLNILRLTLNPGDSTATLQHPPAIVAIVQDWLARGMRVTIPQRELTLHAWTGSAWVVEDPDTAARGYFISGNWAGGATAEPGDAWELEFLAQALMDPYAAQRNTDPLSAARVRKVPQTDFQVAAAGHETPSPLAVYVTDRVGRPVVGARVAFASPLGTLLAADGSPFPGTALSDLHGIARVRLKVGTSTSVNESFILANPSDENPTRASVHSIEASVVDSDGHPHHINGPFNAYAIPDAPDHLKQMVAPQFETPALYAGSALFDLQDQYNNSISNRIVTYRVGTFVAHDASGDPIPGDGIRKPRVFRLGDCDTRSDPTLGTCGSDSSIQIKSSINGAPVGIFVGDSFNTDFKFSVEVDGIEPKEFTIHTNGSSGCTVDQFGGECVYLIQIVGVSERGEIIEAAKLGEPLPRDRELTVLTARQTSLQSPTVSWVVPSAVNDPTYGITHGGVLGSVVRQGASKFILPLRGAAAPAFHDINLFLRSLTVASGEPEHGPFHLGAYGYFSTDAQINSVNPTTLTLLADGTPSAPIKIKLTVLPEYFNPEVVAYLLEDGVPVQAAFAGARDVEDFSQQIELPAAFQLDGHKQYAVRVVLNPGTPYQLVVGQQNLSTGQNLFYDVSRNYHLSQLLDVPLQYVCERGDRFAYATAQEARVTLKFYRLDASGNPSQTGHTLIDNELVQAGDHFLEIKPTDLEAGTYRFELSGIATADGHTELVAGSAENDYTTINTLPIGHPLVHGVDLFDGHLTVSREDVALGGRGPALRLARTYSSLDDQVGAFGRGWSNNYVSEVKSTPCGDYIVTGAEGQGMRFLPTIGGVFRPAAGYHGTLQKSATGFEFYPPDGTHFHYESRPTGSAWLEYIEDTNGNRVSLTYLPDAKVPRPSVVRDGAGRTLTFSYKDATLVSGGAVKLAARVTGPGNLQLDFTYDSQGYLTDARRNDGTGAGAQHERYLYTADTVHPLALKPLAQVEDAIGHSTWTYEYSTITAAILVPGGQTFSFPGNDVISVTAPDQAKAAFSYEGSLGGTTPLTRTVKDGRGADTTYLLNGYGAPTQMTDVAGTLEMTWDAQHVEPLTRKDRNGTLTTYTYDTNGNKLTENIVSTSGSLSRIWTYEEPTQFASPGIKNRMGSYRDARGILTTYTYDERGNRIATSRGGVTTLAHYGQNGDRAQTVNGRAQPTTYTYDAYGNATSATDELGLAWSAVFDERDRKVSERDGAGAETSYGHDSRDRVISITYPATQAGIGKRTIAYDDGARTRTETDENQHATVTTYDSMGRVLSVRNAANDTQSFVYDENGNKTSDTDFRHKTTTFEYDFANRLSKRHEPEGRDSVYEYDAEGHVRFETVGSGGEQRVTEYQYETPEYHRTKQRRRLDTSTWAETITAYDGNGNVTSITDPLQHVTTREFDNRDRLQKTTEPLDRITTYGYDDDDNRTLEVLNLSPLRERGFVYDVRNRETLRTDGTGGEWATTYDTAGNVRTRSDPRHFAVTYSYDARHRATRQSGPETGMVTEYGLDLVGNRVQETWANGRVLTHGYDALNRLSQSSDDLGPLLVRTYDGNGNLLTETDANINVTTHHYDDLNRRTSSDLPEARTVAWTYTLHGEVKTATDANHHVVTYQYDSLGRRVAELTELGQHGNWSYDLAGNVTAWVDANGKSTTYAYDELNRKKLQTDSPELGTSQSWTYDFADHPLTQLDRRGVSDAWKYDAEGRPQEHRRSDIVIERREYDASGNLAALTDANVNRSTYVYDKANRQVEEHRPLDTVTTTTYWPLGDVHTVTDPDQHTTTREYDARRRLKTETNAAQETTRYGYDGNGNRTTMQRPRDVSNTWTYRYDHANRLREVESPLAAVTHVDYDGNGNVLTRRDAKDHVTTFTYDVLNRPLTRTYPTTTAGTATVIDTYDGNGNVLTHTDANGRTQTFTWDALNRRTTATYSGAGPADIASAVYTHDGNGNLTHETLTRGDGTSEALTRHYDPFDRLSDETNRDGQLLSYVYDLNGNRTQRSGDTGTVQYTPDALNRIVRVDDPAVGAVITTYTKAGRLAQLDYADGTRSQWTYDPAGRLTTIEHRRAGATLSAYGYAYDPNGNRTEQHETNGGPEAVTTYEYDKSDRLTDITYPDQRAHYTLDEVGNRRVESIDDAQGTPIARKTATFNDRDQLTRVSDSVAGLVIDYTYDLAGNQITKTQGPQTTELSYGPRDRLATLTLQGAPPSEVTHYAYDDAGLRIEKQTDGTLTRYQYDQGSLIGERNGLGNVLVRYSHGAERTLARSTGPTTLRYLHDGLKTPTTLLAADGGIAARDQYDAWGQVRNHSGASQPIGFTGYYHDDESGYYYAKARYYDATTARFTSEDPEMGALQTPPSLHRYLYAYANPTVYTDPTGRQVWGESVALGYAESDDERNKLMRSIANKDATTGRLVGTALPFVRTAREIESAVDDFGSADPAARHRNAARLQGLQAAQREWMPYALSGPGGIAKKLFTDLGTSLGTHAGQMKEAYDKDDFVGQGEAGVGLAGDVAEVTGLASGVREGIRHGLRGLSDSVVTVAEPRDVVRRSGIVEDASDSAANPAVEELVPNVAEPPKSYGTPFKQMSARQRADFREERANRTATREQYERYDWDRRFTERRRDGVREFWAQERERLANGETGTRNWTEQQRAEILAGETPTMDGKPIEGHHRYSALQYPQLANDPAYIYPATRPEHLYRWHGGSTRNATHGAPLDPTYPEEF